MSDSSQRLPWYHEGLSFACTQCGNCCSGAPGYVWVNGPEIEAIARHLGLSVADFKARHVRRAGRGYSLAELPDGDCEFLERRGGKTLCRIHTVRPVQCRTWPFWKSNVATRAAWDEAARDCPGMNCGPTYSQAFIEQCLKDNGRRPL